MIPPYLVTLVPSSMAAINPIIALESFPVPSRYRSAPMTSASDRRAVSISASTRSSTFVPAPDVLMSVRPSMVRFASYWLQSNCMTVFVRRRVMSNVSRPEYDCAFVRSYRIDCRIVSPPSRSTRSLDIIRTNSGLELKKLSISPGRYESTAVAAMSPSTVLISAGSATFYPPLAASPSPYRSPANSPGPNFLATASAARSRQLTIPSFVFPGGVGVTR